MAGRGSKPGERRGGRQLGTPNKITAGLKQAIEDALNAVGGTGYLERVAVRYPQTFCMLVARIIPRDLHVSVPEQKGGEKSNMFETARRLCFVLGVGATSAEGAKGREAKRTAKATRRRRATA